MGITHKDELRCPTWDSSSRVWWKFQAYISWCGYQNKQKCTVRQLYSQAKSETIAHGNRTASDWWKKALRHARFAKLKGSYCLLTRSEVHNHNSIPWTVVGGKFYSLQLSCCVARSLWGRRCRSRRSLSWGRWTEKDPSTWPRLFPCCTAQRFSQCWRYGKPINLTAVDKEAFRALEAY